MASPYSELSKKQILQISAIVKEKGKISAVEFNSIISVGADDNKTNKFHFHFECKISSPSPDEIRVLIIGRHYSKNCINSWSLRKKLTYKSSIKKAFDDAYFINRNVLRRVPFPLVEIENIVTLKRHRDDDNNYDTLKIIRDCAVRHKIIVDDSRKIVLNSTLKEIIGKEYCIELIIRNKPLIG